jgi:glycine oxidase
MRADILIVGQGLAGTLIGWEFERAGIPFEMVDAGPAAAASTVAAGMINPITGRRLVKSWQIETWLPLAAATYRELESALAVPLWSPMRVRRLFADERERAIALEKYARGELAPYVVAEPDEFGCWIENAARVDVPALLAATRARWKRAGCLREAAVDELATEANGHELVIDCRGFAGARAREFDFVPWEFSKGEILVVDVEGLHPEVILNRGHWVLPVGANAGWIGATHEPGVVDRGPTSEGRSQLAASAKILLQRPFIVTNHLAGVRVNLPDKRPVVGRHPRHPRIALTNGLGAKGSLWAPAIARQWVNHLTEGVSFDRVIGLERFLDREAHAPDG